MNRLKMIYTGLLFVQTYFLVIAAIDIYIFTYHVTLQQGTFFNLWT